MTPRRPQPLPAQLDVLGHAHEIAPGHERLRLFEPAPAQLDGQTWLELDELERETDGQRNERTER
jgi:hypothetical protein